MKIQPIAAPSAVQQAPSTSSAKAAAVAAFMNPSGGQTQGNAQPEAVANPNQVSPEEMSAVSTPDKQEDVLEDTQAPETTEEPQEEVEKPKTPEELKLSQQFAQLARQEKAHRAKVQQQEQAYNTKMAELQAREAKITQAPVDRSQYFTKDDIKRNALGILEAAGVSYEELTQQVINPIQTDPRVQDTISRLEAKIAQLEEQSNTVKTSYEQQQEQAYKAAVKQIETDVKTLVNNDPSFEAIKHAGATKDVVDLIEQTYHKDGYLMSVEDAAQAVEDYLVEQYTELTKIGKIKQRITQAQAQKPAQSTPQQTPGKPQETKQQQPMKTLTNNKSSTGQLSARERALLAFKGEKV